MSSGVSCLHASFRGFVLVCLLVFVSGEVRNTTREGNSSAGGAVAMPVAAYYEVEIEDDTLDEFALENRLSFQAFLDSGVKTLDPIMKAISGFFEDFIRNTYSQTDSSVTRLEKNVNLHKQR